MLTLIGKDMELCRSWELPADHTHVFSGLSHPTMPVNDGDHSVSTSATAGNRPLMVNC